MSTFRFSILTITLNAEKYLDETLSSVLNQKFDSYEHLVWDGGSQDKTLSIIQRYPNIKLFQGKDLGIADAMNRVAQYAQGEYLLHLHADDCLADPYVLENVDLTLKQHKNPAWLYGRAHLMDSQSCILKTTPFEYYHPKRLRKYNFITHPATFISRRSFEKVGGFRTQWKYCMDYDLWLRLSQMTTPYAMHRVLANFRAHPGSLSTREQKGVADEAYAVRSEYITSFWEKYRSYRTWKKKII